jgi:hypothetical protein
MKFKVIMPFQTINAEKGKTKRPYLVLATHVKKFEAHRRKNFTPDSNTVVFA